MVDLCIDDVTMSGLHVSERIVGQAIGGISLAFLWV